MHGIPGCVKQSGGYDKVRSLFKELTVHILVNVRASEVPKRL